MKNWEIQLLTEAFWNKERQRSVDGNSWWFPDFEHRFDKESSAILYSIIRLFQPVRALEIGSSRGGSTCIIMQALQKNGKQFEFQSSEIADDLRQQAYDNCMKVCGEAPKMLGDITKSSERLSPGIDFLMVDTDHDLSTTTWILDNVFPHLVSGALVVFHDWAVEEKDGKLIGKGSDGAGGWDETNHLMDLIRNNQWPFEKLYWTWKNSAWPNMSPTCDTAFWRKT